MDDILHEELKNIAMEAADLLICWNSHIRGELVVEMETTYSRIKVRRMQISEHGRRAPSSVRSL